MGFRGIGLITSFFCIETAISTKVSLALDGRLRKKGARSMNFKAIKAAVMNLDAGEQRRVVLELLPEIWPQIVGDDACLKLIRKLVDEESVRRYQEEHLDEI
jgi:hypothetical protein